MVIKTVRYWHKDKWKRIESPEINPHVSQYMWNDFDTGAKTIQWGERTVFPTSALGKTDLRMQKNEGRPSPVPHTKTNSKWIKGLNRRANTIGLLKGNTAEKRHDTGFGNDFLAVTPKVQAAKWTWNKLNYVKVKKLLYIEGHDKQSEKGKPCNGRKYLQTVHLIRELTSRQMMNS